MSAVPVDIELIRDALEATDLALTADIGFRTHHVARANAEIVRLGRHFGANPESLRLAQVTSVVRLIELCEASLDPHEALPWVAFAVEQ